MVVVSLYFVFDYDREQNLLTPPSLCRQYSPLRTCPVDINRLITSYICTLSPYEVDMVLKY